ncbi:Nucleotide-binding universal stress protein, UspA family [Variovorax sp. OK605]|uniref:universal stress protein n=1 Tax=unclassified Variovorax TaxID=663243 RepID=UPI0008D5410F|nr:MULTISPECIES: universal stress protein [unclassified Variovorax]SEJ25969.1 Nucleotide-binding universal stress protein, UspA family [Variovorax sp. OK202]SFC18757.1 Nucleotide-binding universal stress protein, UspA family [Variovorax sp. OK212]SFO76193.1 Nucleotide-binding universal stress protein, UspA family [Variovorax sp. OK605]
MNIQSILAVTDLSAQGRRTVVRAASIAAAHGALLKLMYAPAAFAGAAGADADAAQGLGALCVEVAERFGILVKKIDDTGGRLESAAQEARWCDLVVIGGEPDRRVAAFFHGQPAEQLLRAAQRPVLVTRLDARESGYSRILVAVDLMNESRPLVDLACAFDSAAEIELFHAFTAMHEGKLRYADVSAHIIDAYRHACARHARERMLWLSDPSSARRNRVVSSIGRGDPARQAAVQQQYTNADLLVVGKRKRSALMDFLFGSVALRALRWSTGDVLVVPHGALAEWQGRRAAALAP